VLKPTAARFEGGSFNMPGLHALGASLGLFLELGPDAVARRIMDRAAALREAAASAGFHILGSTRPGDLSSIVAVEKPGVDPGKAATELRRQGVVASCRRGRLRFSPHLYNNSDDFERLRAGLASLG
jgi:selenocysteine lyase/cysteine desulfurase